MKTPLRFSGATACLLFLSAVSFAAVRPPNIVFIVVDDMGWADLGCYGSHAIQTPNIDRMASEGMRFTQAYSGCTVCAPARSVLMTGLHMGHTSVRGNTGGIPLRDEDVTVAEVLRPAGYATGGFGKWGIGDLDTPGVPEKQGFDVFFGYYHQIHAHYFYPDYVIRSGKKVDLPGNRGFYQQKQKGGFFPDINPKSGKPAQFTHALVFEEMTKFIRQHRDRPFFCYAPWTPPHGRYEMPASDPACALYRDKPWSQKAKVIAAMDTMIDRQVGKLMKLLEELEIDDQTVVFFTSDNGAASRLEGELNSSGPLRGQKRDMYEGGLRVPLIARWPGRIAAGAVSDHICYFGDMMTTFAELAGSTERVPKSTDGISIVPTLLGQSAQREHAFLYWEWQLYNWGKKQPVPTGLMQAVRAGNWKLLRHRSDKPWELYDLSKDLGEKQNLAAAHPAVLERLRKIVAQARTEPRPQIEPEKAPGKHYR